MRKVGLDLGTGKCCVAIARDGKVTVLPDARGDKTTPSFVAFNEYRTLAGSDARDQANINATNTAYGIKILLGRTLEDPAVVGKLESEYNVALPFPPYQQGRDGVPEFQFQYKKKKLNLRPEQITALLIGKMKSIAEKYLDRDVNGAVISVPVSFNTAQRQASLNAARIAGLQNSTLVNCTTAAAVAYWDHTLRKDDCIAVVDIGAGSVNFAIVSIKSGNIKVEDAYGDCEVGGSDIDLCMMSALVQKFNEENPVEFQRSTKALMRLRRATESLKHKLSLLPTGRIQEDAFSVEDYTSMTFTRQEMVESCKEVLGVVSAGLSRLKSSKLWDEVRCAVVVGGSTRIPAVQRMISSVLNKPVDQSLNKDEAIACGAALLGSGSTSSPEVGEVLGRRIWCESKMENFVVFDIGTAFPVDVALERPLSCDMEVWENLTPLEDGKQDKFQLCSLAAHNKNKRVYQGGLIFSVNESGIFRAERISEGKSIDIALKIPCLNTNSLFCCVETHQRFLRESKELEQNEDAMNDLEYFCSEQRQIVEEELGGNEELTQFLDSVLQWLEETPDATKTECDLKKRKIDEIRALQQHASLGVNSLQEDDFTPVRDERLSTKHDVDHTDRFHKIPSYEIDNGNNFKNWRTHSEDSRDRVPHSNYHNKNFVHGENAFETSGPTTPVDVSSRGNNIYNNSYTQGPHSYSAYKPLPGNGPNNSWSSDTRKQLPDVGHQPVSHAEPSPVKGSSVVKDISPRPSKMNSKPSLPDHLTGSPRTERRLTGDIELGSDRRCNGSDYNISQYNTEQSYMSEGFPTKRQNDRTNRNDEHQAPVVNDSSHDANLIGRKTATGSRSNTSRDKHSRTNQNNGNNSHQASHTPGVQKSLDARSPKVHGSSSRSTGRAVGGSVAGQQDRSPPNYASPESGFGSGGDAYHHANENEYHARREMDGSEVGGERSRKLKIGCCTLL